MKAFFILGLPRSRTAWLANLFTTDRTHCFHELFFFNEPGVILNLFEIIGKQYEYVGNSDPFPSGYMNVKQYFPNSPVVVIERSPEDSLASFTNFISLPSNAGSQKAIAGMYVVCLKDLDVIKEQQNAVTESFDDLNKQDAIERIWNHCIPTIGLDTLRLRLLQRLRVAEKYSSLADVHQYIIKKENLVNTLTGR